MIHLLIDSTHYKQDYTLSKADFAKIRALGGKGHLKLYIPYVVYQECLTGAVEHLRSNTNQALKNIRSLGGRGLYASHLPELSGAIDSLESLLPRLQMSAKMVWDDFAGEAKAEMLPLNMHLTPHVFGAYFSGGSPFKTVKERKDIPDAYIYFEAIGIAQAGKEKGEGPLIVLTNDGNLHDKLNEEENIIAYKTWQQFYNDAQYKTEEQVYRKTTAAENELAIVRSNVSKIENQIKEELEGAHGYEIIVNYSSRGVIQCIEGEIDNFEDFTVKVVLDGIEAFGGKILIPIRVFGIANIIIRAPYHVIEDVDVMEITPPGFATYHEEVEYGIDRPFVGFKTFQVPFEEIKDGEDVSIKFDQFDRLYTTTKLYTKNK